MGGLHIQHPEEKAEDLRINLIQKHHRKMEQGNHTKFTNNQGPTPLNRATQSSRSHQLHGSRGVDENQWETEEWTFNARTRI
jgi:hypothetical protein